MSSRAATCIRRIRVSSRWIHVLLVCREILIMLNSFFFHVSQNSLELSVRMMFKEVFKVHVPSSYSYNKLVIDNFGIDLLKSKQVVSVSKPFDRNSTVLSSHQFNHHFISLVYRLKEFSQLPFSLFRRLSIIFSLNLLRKENSTLQFLNVLLHLFLFLSLLAYPFFFLLQSSFNLL